MMKAKPVQTLVDEQINAKCRECGKEHAHIQTLTNLTSHQGRKVTRYEEHTACRSCGFSEIVEWMEYKRSEAKA